MIKLTEKQFQEMRSLQGSTVNPEKAEELRKLRCDVDVDGFVWTVPSEREVEITD